MCCLCVFRCIAEITQPDLFRYKTQGPAPADAACQFFFFDHIGMQPYIDREICVVLLLMMSLIVQR